MIPRKIRRTLRSLFRRKRVNDELDRELAFHLDMESKKNSERGLQDRDARAAALRDFGGVDLHKEECRDVGSGRVIEQFFQDVRYGVRVLARSPGFTCIAVVTLALGIGANTAMFSVIYGAVLKPLPYANGNRLVLIHQQATLAHVDDMQFSVKEINDYRQQNHTLDAVVEHHSMSFILYGRKEPERVQTSVVSANFFDVLGVRPLLGRTFVPSDDEPGADAVLVLSNEYWQRSFSGDPNIVGKVFQMNNKPHTVIGVLPPIPQYPVISDVYMPTSACPFRSSKTMIEGRDHRMMDVFGRLKSGVTVAQAQADLSTIATNLARQYPESYPANIGYSARVESLRKELTDRARPTFLLLLATAGFVLLIACGNVANIGIARMMRRQREMAVRAALGASRGRLVRQVLTESTILSVAGGAAGLLLAAGALKVLVAFAEKLTNRAGEIKIDGWVLLFTLVLSVGTGLIFGLLPALTSHRDLSSGIKEGAGRGAGGSSRHHAVRSILIVAQVAVSFVLLIGAGLMLRSLLKLQSINPGFSPENVLVMRVSPNWSKYDTNEKIREFDKRLVDEARVQPGVSFAALASTFPMNPAGITFGPSSQDFIIEGQPQNDGPIPIADMRTVTPSYFQTVGVPLVKGRTFAQSDNKDAPLVAVINQSMARHRWGDQDPIGRRISFDKGEHWVTIIGIIGDVRQYGPERSPTDELYTVNDQNVGANNLLVRTASDPMSVANLLREAIHKVDSETAVDRVETLEKARSDAVSTPRLTSYLLALFAGLALLITIAGITGVMVLSVNQRTHELGVRMALGASTGQVMGLVVRGGMTLVAGGLVIGVVGALALTRLMTALLFAVEPTDVMTFVLVSGTLLAVATAACVLPAARATSIDPVKSLRFE